MKESHSPVQKFSGYQSMVLVLLALLQFTVLLDFMIISPIGYVLTADLDISTDQFGLIVSSYIFTAAAAGFLAAGFIDRYDRKKVLLFFFAGFIIGTLFCALSDSWITLLSARIFTGLFGGVISSLAVTIIADLFAASQRGRAMSSIQMAFAASQVFGVPLGLFITNHLNWHYTFFLIVAISSVTLVFIILKLKPIDEHLKTRTDKNPFLHLWQTISNRQHLTGFTAMVVISIGMMLQPFISIFLISNVHLSNDQLPVIFMVSGTAAFFIMPFVGKLADKFDRFKIFLIGSLATVVIIPVYTHLPVVPLWVVLILNVILFAVIMSRMGPFQALNSMIPEPANRGAYMSISSSLQQMSGGLGIVIAGFIVSQQTPASPLENFDLLGYVVVALTVFAIFLVYRVNLVAKKAIQKQLSVQAKQN